ncbi:OLC1v1026919C1 [Oldenlandia corymbosa var. corymbosa]|uniref:OLC1v1026919C1 n=1 Tax=Oldenlandia corymbosa var. corymbosa TaxID=529605 RepID=A0AAV1C878_OLDCO|nr:OLC1v1026919C1 [Oldenlandia corymbosa var. corymbosa]
MSITRQNSTKSSKGNLDSTPDPKPLQKSGKRQKTTENQEEGVISCVDRISGFPDSVLLHILSFLPTQNVVRSMVLSKRWEPLWTSVPCLNFDQSSYQPPKRRHKVVNFMTFVNRVMLEHDSGSVRKFGKHYPFAYFKALFLCLFRLRNSLPRRTGCSLPNLKTLELDSVKFQDNNT